MGSVALRAPARRARQCHWSLKPRPASSADTSRTWASLCNVYEFLMAKLLCPDPANSPSLPVAGFVRHPDKFQRHPVALSDGGVLGAIARVGGGVVGACLERR